MSVFKSITSWMIIKSPESSRAVIGWIWVAFGLLGVLNAAIQPLSLLTGRVPTFSLTTILGICINGIPVFFGFAFLNRKYWTRLPLEILSWLSLAWVLILVLFIMPWTYESTYGTTAQLIIAIIPRIPILLSCFIFIFFITNLRSPQLRAMYAKPEANL